jgi:hypothetical protein
MTKLRLRVDKYVEDDGDIPPQILATIYSVGPASGNRAKKVVRREMVPISHQSSHARELDLKPGHYFVEVTMPSGEILSENVELSSGREQDLVLNAEDSPHEWLSWQHLVGNVGAVQRAAQEFIAPPRGVHFFSQPAPTTGVADAFRAEWLTKPMPGLALAESPAPDVWQALAKLPSSTTLVSQKLNSGHTAKRIPLVVSDPVSAVLRLVYDTASSNDAFPVHSKNNREFLAVRHRDRYELVSLPMPWRIMASGGRQAVIEAVVTQPFSPDDFATSLAVRDSRLGVLLGFLASGSLGPAREIAQISQKLLYYKIENPLAAAAGAYAMVGAVTDSKKQDWHQWVRNLATRFKQIPDGAVLLAMLHLRLRRGHADISEAHNWFKTAYRRGLPFYSLGIRWLLTGLEKFATADSEAESMRKAVHNIAWRIHPQSPFTIIGLGGH